MSSRCNIGMLGCGTVGTGVVKLLLSEPQRLLHRTGREFVVRRIVVRDPKKQRDAALSDELLSTSAEDVLRDPEIEIVVELLGGLQPARDWIEQALRAGKDVVTANKAVLATYGPELMTLARSLGRTIAFEATVAGGVPIVSTLRQALTANKIRRLVGILNGTSNFILTGMSAGQQELAEALSKAQELGYAEADPSWDVDGSDATQKLAILASLISGQRVDWRQIPRKGIEHVQACDLQWSKEHGFTIKPLAIAIFNSTRSEHSTSHAVLSGPGGPASAGGASRSDSLELLHSPCLVPLESCLARANDALNAILVEGHALGSLFLQGLGAGQLPTASAVVADLIDVVLGRAQATDKSMPLFPEDATVWSPYTSGSAMRYYVRGSIAPDLTRLREIESTLEPTLDPGASLADAWDPGQANLCVQTLTRPLTLDLLMALTRKLSEKISVPPWVMFPVFDP